VFTLIALLAGSVSAARPAPSPDPTGSHPPAVVFTGTIERRTEGVRYHFANPSTFDTVDPVPHFFEQRYDTSNAWIAIAASYRLGRMTARTDAGFAPRVTTAGSDLDTFFDPSGDVIVSGTDGRVSLASWEIGERLGITTWHGWRLGVTVNYRRSRADFPPDIIVVTHTQPSSVTRSFTTDRETTVSQVFESGFIADRTATLGSLWRLRTELDLLPTSRARLRVSLPDKYPDDVTAQALALGAKARITIERAVGPLTAGVAATFDAAWSYGQDSAYRVRGAGVMLVMRTSR
jgi:hypothetical protein